MNLRFDRKTVFGLLGVVLFAAVAYALPVPDALAASAAAQGYTGQTAMRVLAGLLWAICWWAGMVVPEWVTALGLQCVWILTAGLSFPMVFAAFSKTSAWLILGAFTLGAAVSKTGLLTRISLALVRLFPPTYRGQVLAMLSIGTVCAPLMPSTTAKVVLGSRLAESTATLMGYAPDSNGRCGLFLASFTGWALTAPMYLSASFMAYTLLDSLPGEYAAISWGEWFFSMLPWGILLLIGMYLVIMLAYRPKRYADADISAVEIRRKYDALGPVSKQEKITGAIIGTCLICWVFERSIGVSAGLTALMGALCCFAFRILDNHEISTAIPWGTVLFTGVVLNMGEIFIATGISDWLLQLIDPLLPYVGTPVAMVVFVLIVTVLLRLVLASQTAVIALLTSVFAPVALSVGIHPFITGLVVYTAIPCWLTLYQNATYLTAQESMGGTITHGVTVKAAWLYLLVDLAACLGSIPYWALRGYL